MKDFAKILCYFVAVIVLGALLAPQLYWAGHALAARGVLRFLGDVPLEKFFSRAVLIVALASIWPMLRWLRLDGWRGLSIDPNPCWKQHFAVGAGVAALCVGLMATGYVLGGVYRWKGTLPWGTLPKLLLSAVVVGMLEEFLFRAGVLGLFRRTLRPWGAVLLTSALFAAVHFLRSDDSFEIGTVNWLSGFALIPVIFHKFGEPSLIVAEFTTLFVLGLLLADTTVRTRSLWMGIGFHAGLVFVKMSFSKFTKRADAHLPWIGEELQIGLVPVFALLFGWVLARLWIKYANAACRA